jgi:hypothetical protein
MIDEYIRDLATQLAVLGVRGADARRLLTEARGHLEESAVQSGEDEAVNAFGPARQLAELVAGDLATARTRTAAVAAFAVLGVAAAVYAALFLTIPFAGSPDLFGGSMPGLAALAFTGIVFFPQLAFVSGCLALIRVVRLRRRGALPVAELSVQRWRTGVALGAGFATFASLSVVALDLRHDLASWWVTSAIVGSASISLLLVVAAATSIRSTRPAALLEGRADDVFDDIADVLAHVPGLGWLRLPSEPRRLPFAVASAAAVGVALSGVVAMDPIDGLVRGLGEGLAVLGCYAVVGGRLGLRS